MKWWRMISSLHDDGYCVGGGGGDVFSVTDGGGVLGRFSAVVVIPSSLDRIGGKYNYILCVYVCV